MPVHAPAPLTTVVTPAPLTPHLAPLSHYKLEIGWGQGSSGLFRFGYSVFGGPDVLAASSWSASFNGVYDNITGPAVAALGVMPRHATITRGRDGDGAAFRAGTIDLSLIDANGTLNRFNPASPLYGYVTSDLPLRLTGYTAAGTAYPLFYGFTKTIEADPTQRGSARITAADLLDKFSGRNPVLQPQLSPTTGSVIGAMLDWLQWTDPAMRQLAVGDSFTGAGFGYTRADGSADMLSLISDLLQTERGIVYANAAGAAVYQDRHTRALLASSGTIDRTLTAFPVGTDGGTVANIWSVQRTDMAGNLLGPVQTASDAASRQKHGDLPGQPNPLQTPFLDSDSQALALAQMLVAQTKDGYSNVYEVPLRAVDDATLAQMLGSDIGDRKTLTVAPLGFASFTSDFHIESITHEIDTDPTAPRHQTSWLVSQVPQVSMFRFGVSTMGGADALWY